MTSKVKVITVDAERNKLLHNGLVDLKRDILMKLLRIIQDGKKTKTIMGMMKEFYPWISQRIFLKIQSSHIPSFKRNSRGNCVINPRKKECTFKEEMRTVFLDTLVTKGIFNWTVKIKYVTDKESSLYIGIAPPDRINICEDYSLGYFDPDTLHGTCSFRFWRRSADGVYVSCLRGVKDFADAPEVENQVPDEANVSLEVDIEKRMLNFYINGKRVTHGISHIPVPFIFGMSGIHASFASRSFRHLPAATGSASPIKYHECKEPKAKAKV